jgi:hypothetical protein
MTFIPQTEPLWVGLRDSYYARAQLLSCPDAA